MAGVREKSYCFALKIISLHRELLDRKEFVLSKQLLKSGTSIGANVEEASAAQSRADFISKMSIASKEARETHFWLRLIKDSGILQSGIVDNLLSEAQELVKMLTAIVKTSRERQF